MAAIHLDQVDPSLVDLACQDHLDDVHGLLVGDPQAVDEHGLLAQALHDVADLRTAAVDQDHLHADEPQQGNVLHDLLFQLLVDHGVTAVLNDDDLAAVLFNVGQGSGQDFCPLRVGKHTFHMYYSSYKTLCHCGPV